MTELTNRVALVTGGGRGIGRATALELARRGAKIALAARSASEIEAVANEIRELGRPALAVQVELLEGGPAIQALVAQVEAKLGPLDILINNAAMAGPFGPGWEIDPDEWARAVQINLIAPFRLAHAVLPGMRERGWGRIINVSSGAARNPIERAGPYSVTKAGIDMLTKQMGLELGDSGVVTISVYPGIVDTAMQTTIREQSVEKLGAATATRFHNYHASGQLQAPDRPGRLIAILSGEAGAKLNGQVVDIYDQAFQALLVE